MESWNDYFVRDLRDSLHYTEDERPADMQRGANASHAHPTRARTALRHALQLLSIGRREMSWDAGTSNEL